MPRVAVSMGVSIAARPTGPRTPGPRPASSGSIDAVAIIAIQGFLEWFFAGLLASLVGMVTLFAGYVALQMFRNPGRGPGAGP